MYVREREKMRSHSRTNARASRAEFLVPARARAWIATLLLSWAAAVAAWEPANASQTIGVTADSASEQDDASPSNMTSTAFEPAWDIFGFDKPVVETRRKIRAPEPFPFLPGESPEGSVSTGTVTDGSIYLSAEIPDDNPALTVLPRQQSRGLRYGSTAMIDAIVRAAEAVAQRYPGSVLGVGNIGRRHGGDIPWSVSHNSGLDADFAFYARSADGEYAVLPDLLSFNSDGTCEQNGNVWHFDAERNWVFIRELLLDPNIAVQRLFVSDPLRDELLRFARAAGESADVLQRASDVLSQPGAAIPHDDHLHLRIHCAARDVAGGCTRVGPLRAWASDHHESLARTRSEATRALDATESSVRASAIRRLVLVGPPPGARARIAELISDDVEEVRLQAAYALEQLGMSSATPRMEEQLAIESAARVRQQLVRGLVLLRSDNAWAIASELLRTPEVLEQGGKEWDFRLAVVDALGMSTSVRAVETLLGAPFWRSDCRGGMELRYRSAQALAQITNVGHADVTASRFHLPSPAGEEGSENAVENTELYAEMVRPWTDWLDEWGGRDGQRERWVLEGFREAGFDVGERGIELARELARAAGTRRTYLRENAQRYLMNWSGNEVRSLEWSAEDAGVYWRRYVDRKPWRFR